MKTSNRSKGNKGEEIACRYIIGKGFSIIERNYLKKWGEIDIIANKNRVLYFFEVKSVEWEINSKGHRPEDNVHGLKIKRLRRTIECYLEERGYGLENEFVFCVICVYMNMLTKRANIKLIENVIL